jgi:hypothetical protein
MVGRLTDLGEELRASSSDLGAICDTRRRAEARRQGRSHAPQAACHPAPLAGCVAVNLPANPEPKAQSVIHELQGRRRQTAGFLCNAFPWDAHNLIHHDLRRDRESRARAGLHRDAKQRSVDQMRGNGTQGDAGVCLVEEIALYDHRGARFTVVARRNAHDYIASFQVQTFQISAVQIQCLSSAPAAQNRSSGVVRAEASRDCLRASAASESSRIRSRYSRSAWVSIQFLPLPDWLAADSRRMRSSSLIRKLEVVELTTGS